MTSCDCHHDYVACMRNKCKCECHPRNRPVAHSGPLFPVRLCIYGLPGSAAEDRYSPIDIVSEQQLYGVGTKFAVKSAMAERRKIVMEDSGGLCVFHAEAGVILFPTREQLEAR